MVFLQSPTREHATADSFVIEERLQVEDLKKKILIYNLKVLLLLRTDSHLHLKPTTLKIQRVFTGTNEFWLLPVMFRVDSEVLLTHKAFNGLRALLLNTVCTVPPRTLCSSAGGLLEVSSRRQKIGNAALMNYTTEL